MAVSKSSFFLIAKHEHQYQQTYHAHDTKPDAGKACTCQEASK